MKTVLMLVAALAFGVPLSAEPVSTLKPSGYVNDFANVLDKGTVAHLEELCRQVDQKAHAQIAVVTVKSLDGGDIRQYSVNLFRKWGIGAKATNRGLLILIATQDHHYRITTGYGLESVLPEEQLSRFGKEAVPLLKQGDYGGAVSRMTSSVAGAIAQNADVSLSDTEPQATAPQAASGPLQSPPSEASETGMSSAMVVVIIGSVLAVGVSIWRHIRARSVFFQGDDSGSNSMTDPNPADGGLSIFTNPTPPVVFVDSPVSPDNSDRISDSGGSDCSSNFAGGDASGSGSDGSW